MIYIYRCYRCYLALQWNSFQAQHTRTIVERVPAVVQVLAESSGMISCAQRVLQAVDQRAQVMESPTDLWSLI